jgi:hypothetical protein
MSSVIGDPFFLHSIFRLLLNGVKFKIVLARTSSPDYIAQVDPLLPQLALLLELESPPVEAKAENIFSGLGAPQIGQFNSEPSAPMR